MIIMISKQFIFCNKRVWVLSLFLWTDETTKS